MDLGGLRVGVTVDIKRSDGRVHSAVVSHLNSENKTCTVEWSERGETKGKEIDFDDIFSLNPDVSPNYSRPPKNTASTASVNSGVVLRNPPTTALQPASSNSSTANANGPNPPSRQASSITASAVAQSKLPSSRISLLIPPGGVGGSAKRPVSFINPNAGPDNTYSEDGVDHFTAERPLTAGQSNLPQPRFAAPAKVGPGPAAANLSTVSERQASTVSAPGSQSQSNSNMQSVQPQVVHVQPQANVSAVSKLPTNRSAVPAAPPTNAQAIRAGSVALVGQQQNSARPIAPNAAAPDTSYSQASLHEGRSVRSRERDFGIVGGGGAPVTSEAMDFSNSPGANEDDEDVEMTDEPSRRPAGKEDRGGAGEGRGQAARKNTLKEIERITKAREERRAAARAIRERPDFDPTNPNWEFEQMIKDYLETINISHLNMSDPVIPRQITVCVRKRPINKREISRKEIDVLTVADREHVMVHEPKLKVDLTKYLENQQFRFDYAFDDSADNQLVYHFTAAPLIECVFQGGMATCFAYGQTGSGKTHTMGGEITAKGMQDCTKGIYFMAANDVFHALNTKYKNDGLAVSCSFFEIYSGKVFDLLNKKQRLRVLEDGHNVVQVVGLREDAVYSAEDVLNILRIGTQARTSGQTSANTTSSRSHAVFQIVLRRGKNKQLYGKFSLIDLAGNERAADTISSDRQTRMEGAEINKSLLALKECIRALGRCSVHTPFRLSKLTLVLRDSFIGTNSKTCMIAMISPGNLSCEHSLNTLRYANRVKELEPGVIGAGDETALQDVSPPLVPSDHSSTPSPNKASPGGSPSGAAVAAGANGSRAVAAAGGHQPSPPRLGAGAGAAHQGAGLGAAHSIVPHVGASSKKVQEGAAAVRAALNAEAPSVGAGANNLANVSGLGDESDAESDILSLGHNSSHNSSSNDLALLRSANADEVPEEVFAHTDVVNQLQETEEAIIGNHCDLIEHDIPEFDTQLKELAKLTNEIDYDTEAYATKLSELLGTKIDRFAALKARVDEYLAELRKEELISRTLSAKRGVQPAAAPPQAGSPSMPHAHGLSPPAPPAARHK